MRVNLGSLDSRLIGLLGAFLSARLLDGGAVAPHVTLEGGARFPLQQLSLYGVRIDARWMDVQCDGLGETALASVVAEALESFARHAFDADGYSLGEGIGCGKPRAYEEEDDGE